MWRIHFDPSLGMFKIQFLEWGFLWRTVQRANDQGESLPHYFVTFKQAKTHAQSIGLDEAFFEQDRLAMNSSLFYGGAAKHPSL